MTAIARLAALMAALMVASCGHNPVAAPATTAPTTSVAALATTAPTTSVAALATTAPTTSVAALATTAPTTSVAALATTAPTTSVAALATTTCPTAVEASDTAAALGDAWSDAWGAFYAWSGAVADNDNPGPWLAALTAFADIADWGDAAALAAALAATQLIYTAANAHAVADPEPADAPYAKEDFGGNTPAGHALSADHHAAVTVAYAAAAGEFAAAAGDDESALAEADSAAGFAASALACANYAAAQLTEAAVPVPANSCTTGATNWGAADFDAAEAWPPVAAWVAALAEADSADAWAWVGDAGTAASSAFAAGVEADSAAIAADAFADPSVVSGPFTDPEDYAIEADYRATLAVEYAAEAVEFAAEASHTGAIALAQAAAEFAAAARSCADYAAVQFCARGGGEVVDRFCADFEAAQRQ